MSRERMVQLCEILERPLAERQGRLRDPFFCVAAEGLEEERIRRALKSWAKVEVFFGAPVPDFEVENCVDEVQKEALLRLLIELDGEGTDPDYRPSPENTLLQYATIVARKRNLPRKYRRRLKVGETSDKDGKPLIRFATQYALSGDGDDEILDGRAARELLPAPKADPPSRIAIERAFRRAPERTRLAVALSLTPFTESTKTLRKLADRVGISWNHEQKATERFQRRHPGRDEA